MKKLLARSVFKASGWKYEIDESLLEDKQVLIGLEHTTNLDAVHSLAIFTLVDIKIHILIKKELFVGPLKPFMRAIGGIPVDRKNKGDIVAQMVDEFNKHDKFSLVIAPEGTRALNGEKRRPIRTGFWHIAKAANVPIVMMYAHGKSKRCGLFAKIYPTDLATDLRIIQQKYAEMDIHFSLPEGI